MRARTVGVGCAGLLFALALTGCQDAPDDAAAPPATRVSPSGYGAAFLAVGECGSRGRTSFGEVGCRSERAVARVLARHDGDTADGPACPGGTDFVLHISENRPGKSPAPSRGYACMRNLEPPHPGDPGAGGGPRTVVGDCVYGVGEGQVRETACDGSGESAPQYRVWSAVRARDRCPPSTALYVALGGGEPVGCAVRL
ncbi:MULTISPECIES: hypothetical protein [unclassified Streptomyces]|uniref:hypothetical protein n=1 Tax=unclassified Streptomyces TaxID=2593676 RepID=UPI000DBA8E82|nr:MULTISPECIES: hypothetical protein [unclassified Streptomyces]MYT71426.1 hypothetical protein [Streptomyces sp. SID8367]RAJ82887.1 hypothetical protein K377_03938 [Streptomyces sp. PsTaAH-137]